MPDLRDSEGGHRSHNGNHCRFLFHSLSAMSRTERSRRWTRKARHLRLRIVRPRRSLRHRACPSGCGVRGTPSFGGRPQPFSGSLSSSKRLSFPVLSRTHFSINMKAGFLGRSEEHTSELQSLMRISYAVFCLKKKIICCNTIHITPHGIEY